MKETMYSFRFIFYGGFIGSFLQYFYPVLGMESLWIHALIIAVVIPILFWLDNKLIKRNPEIDRKE